MTGGLSQVTHTDSAARDRQSGPTHARYGTHRLRRCRLPQETCRL